MYKLNWLITILLVLCSATANAIPGKCNNIGLIANSGKYLILNNQTLALVDVGDLRRWGVFELNTLLPGSDLQHLTINVDHLYEHGQKKVIRSGGYFMLPNNWAKGVVTDELLPITGIKDSSYVKIDDSEYYGTRYPGKNGTTIELFNPKKVQSINYKDINSPRIWKPVFCKQEQFIYLIGKNNSVRLKGKQWQVFDHPIPLLPEPVFVANDNCKVLMAERNGADDTVFRVMDVATNSIKGTFKASKSTKSFLFNQGKTLFQQRLNKVKLPYGPSTYRTEPTADFQLIDTRSGKIVKTAKLDRIYGQADKLICKTTQPKLVLKEKGWIHLLDIETLTIIQSKQLPFEQFFVL